ncbi:MAG: aldehyde dehydrogenase (NADP(+)) [Gammaproteobacteria bacterium]|nr:aldehyde dehydrogenase (NADP(+)) [Gammaproteobacteria bacterium]
MIDGRLMVGYQQIRTDGTFRGINAATGESLLPPFSVATAREVERACLLADRAAAAFGQGDRFGRARFLEAIARHIEALGDALLERAALETGLPLARLTGERARTLTQLRLFAHETREGSWMGVRIDSALPERQPLARSDLRMHKVPVGPVAVFGASNFPLAFSVAGGDTASALAAGCPVVVKGHPAHPGTSAMIASAVIAAARECAMPEGVFSLLAGPGIELGQALVRDPRIQAVGFTGSRQGGIALMRLAAARPAPIPVFAEMSSVNPVIILPGALRKRGAAVARGFVTSLTLGAGQFCTNPGLVLLLEGPDQEPFITAAREALQESKPQVMLTPAIHAQYESGLAATQSHSDVMTVARGIEPTAPHCARGALFVTRAEALLAHPELAEELFGPASTLVLCRDETELLAAIASLPGQLTATVHFEPEDLALAARLVDPMQRKAGRVIANGWPTGVEVSHAMVHGGPYPATSDGRSTSVGTLAIERFLRPVCYQDFPEELLPTELRPTAPRAFTYRLDGRFIVPGESPSS